MILAATTVVLGLLPWQVNSLITTDAKCLPGHEWMFSSTGQSPCDIAAELLSVCIGTPVNLSPFQVDNVHDAYIRYFSVSPETQNGCRCSSVTYSLLSACVDCQVGDNGYNNYWSIYITNCSTSYLSVYPYQIPVGVKVPAYPYQNVALYDDFNVSAARSMTGVESSRAPGPSSSSSTQTPPTSASSPSRGTVPGTTNNTPVIVGGVIGGFVGLGLIAVLFTFLHFWRQARLQNNNDNQHMPRHIQIQHDNLNDAHNDKDQNIGDANILYKSTDSSSQSSSS